MNAIEFLKAQVRFCDSYRECDKCPLRDLADAHDLGSCHGLDARYPEELVAIVEKWAAEHPEETLEQVGDGIYFDPMHRIVADEVVRVFTLEVTTVGEKEYNDKMLMECGRNIADEFAESAYPYRVDEARCIRAQQFITKSHEEEV